MLLKIVKASDGDIYRSKTILLLFFKIYHVVGVWRLNFIIGDYLCVVSNVRVQRLQKEKEWVVNIHNWFSTLFTELIVAFFIILVFVFKSFSTHFLFIIRVSQIILNHIITTLFTLLLHFSDAPFPLSHFMIPGSDPESTPFLLDKGWERIIAWSCPKSSSASVGKLNP